MLVLLITLMDIVRCKRCLFILLSLTVCIVPLEVSAQLPELPYTRNELAEVSENDSMVAYHLQYENLREAAMFLDRNAMLFWRHNQLRKAVDYFNRSLDLNRRLGNQNGIAGINSNLAFIYADLEEYEKAYEFFELTLAVRKTVGNPEGIFSALVNESVVLNKLQRYSLAVSKLEEALGYAREMNSERDMRSVYGMLSETYQRMGDVEKALYYYNYYKTFNDYVAQKRVADAEEELERQRLTELNLRLQNENKELELERQRLQIQVQQRGISTLSREQQHLLDSLSGREMAYQLLKERSERQDLQNALLQEEARASSYLLYIAVVSVAALVIILLVVAVAMLRTRRINTELCVSNERIREQSIQINEQNQQLKQSNNTIAQQNQEILASIRYSKQIQDAVMSHSVPLQQMFADSFYFERPYAIVSGDFYYFRRMPLGEKLVVVGDCTGHGVPGAFLTLLAVTSLDHAVFELRLNTCSAILDAVNETFSELNAKRPVANHSMDACICIVRESAGVVEFAGARNGLLVVRDGEPEYIKGSLAMLGQKYSSYPSEIRGFKSVEIQIQEGMWCYLYSDGISDQFNSHGEKFSSRRLRQVLASNSSLAGKAQRERLVDSVSAWQGKSEQIDDMLLIGFSPRCGATSES